MSIKLAYFVIYPLIIYHQDESALDFLKRCIDDLAFT